MNNGSFIMKVIVKLGIYNIHMLELEKYSLVVSIEAKEEKKWVFFFQATSHMKKADQSIRTNATATVKAWING